MPRFSGASMAAIASVVVAETLLLNPSFIRAAPTCGAATDPAKIQDDALKQAIRTQLELTKDTEITCAHMESLHQLPAREKNIVSLQGLEFAIQLEQLDCGRNSISDLTPLSELEKLTELRADRNEIADLRPLVNNTYITKGFRLNVSYNCLELSSNPDAQDIDTLVNRGVIVDPDYKNSQKDRAGCPSRR